MLPTWDQIQRAAYERWERRGWVHGADQDDWIAAEMDVTFQMNYRPAAEYPIAPEEPVVVGSRTRPSCRFCELAAPRAKFSEDRPILPSVVGGGGLLAAEVCDDCHQQFEGSIDADFVAFWRAIQASYGGGPHPATVPIGAFKSLVRMAVAIMPPKELQHFNDAVEWVGNPDHEFDSSLFAGSGCLVYRTHREHAVPWVSLSRRTDPDAPLPYAVFALVSGRTVVEIAPPLCARDQDLDQAALRPPGRSFTTGFGGDSRSATHRLLPLERTERPRRRGMRLFA